MPKFFKKLNQTEIVFDTNVTLLNFKMINAVYLGIDPSNASIHIGHIVLLNLLKYFEQHGLKTYILIGEGTTILGGDPSGRFKEREFINPITIASNAKYITSVIRKIKKNINLKSTIVNNKKWLQSEKWLHVIRNIYSKISVNQLIKQDFFKKRLDLNQHLGLNELIYPIVQGYDFMHLAQRYNCTLQIGGQDQILNILIGNHLIEKKLKRKSFHMVTKLLTDHNNSKIGKSNAKDANNLINSSNTPFNLWHYFRSLNDNTSLQIYKYLYLNTNEEKMINNINDIKIFNANTIINQIYGKRILNIVHKITNAENIDQIHLMNYRVNDLLQIIPSIVINKTTTIENALKNIGWYNNNKEITFALSNKKIILNNNIITSKNCLIYNFIRSDSDFSFLQIGKNKIALIITSS